MRRDGGGRRPSPNRHNRTGAPGAVLDSKQVQGAQPSMGEKALEERLAEMEKKMELKFKADCEAAVAKAYQDGRKQAEEALTSYRLPYPQAMVQSFKELKYIPVKQMRAVCSRVGQVAKPREFAISAEMKVVVPEEEISDDGGRISPIKYFAHLMEIIYGYYFIGGHKSATLLKKMMDYWRLLLALYEIFTFESLVKADEYVRSREEAQGNPKTLTWAIDQTTRYRLLREYQPGTLMQVGTGLRKKKNIKQLQGSRLTQVQAACDNYIKGEECKRPDCIWYHGCRPCKVVSPMPHPLANCVSLEPRVLKLKKQKVRKTLGRPSSQATA